MKQIGAIGIGGDCIRSRHQLPAFPVNHSKSSLLNIEIESES